MRVWASPDGHDGRGTFILCWTDSQQQYACEMRLGERLCKYDNLDEKSRFPETGKWLDDRPTDSGWR